MIDHEFLLAISNMMDNKLEPIKNKMESIENRIESLEIAVKRLEDRVEGLENRIENLENRIESLENRVESLEGRVEGLANQVESLEGRTKTLELAMENKVLPRLETIESCYTSTYHRYKDTVEEYGAMKQDITIIKKVVTEHSERLQKIG